MFAGYQVGGTQPLPITGVCKVSFFIYGRSVLKVRESKKLEDFACNVFPLSGPS
jgi:hypothetical protein